MNIDLETCFLAFLIGFALYLLVNRMIVEGFQLKCPPYNPKNCSNGLEDRCFNPDAGANGTIACGVGNSKDTCENNIGGEGTPFIWCGDDYGKDPSQPPTQTLTPQEQTELKGIIEAAIQGVSKEEEKNIVSLSFDFDTFKSYNRFKNLLDRNTNNSLVSIEDVIYGLYPGWPIILSFEFSVHEIRGDDVDDVDLDISYIVKIVNCFTEDINGINCEDAALAKGGVDVGGDLSALSDLTGLQYLNLSGTSVVGSLSALSDLTELQYLNLEGAGFVGSLSALSRLTKLQILSLVGIDVDGSLSALSGLTELQYLSLNNTLVGGSLSALSDLIELNELYLEAAPNINGSLNDLRKLTGLQELDLCPNEKITGNISDTPNISKLYTNGRAYTDLDDCPQFKDT